MEGSHIDASNKLRACMKIFKPRHLDLEGSVAEKRIGISQIHLSFDVR